MLRLALKAVLAGWAVVVGLLSLRLILLRTLDRVPRIDVEGSPDLVADAVARFVGTRRDLVRR